MEVSGVSIGGKRKLQGNSIAGNSSTNSAGIFTHFFPLAHSELL
jgi:hypothetical protein